MKFPYQLIDLTHVLETTIPTWDRGCGFNPDLQLDYSDCQGDDKFRVMKLRIDAGIGTHIDAPSHCVPGGKNIHEFEVNDLNMPCVVIDVSNKAHAHYRVSAEDINDFESLHGVIAHNTCVLIKTGWGRFWGEPLKYHNNHVFPSVSEETANLLLERGAAALGIDTLSPDCPNHGFKVHQAFLGAGKILIENVANLDNMPPTGAYIIICPLKIRNGTEAPARLLGLIAN